MTQLEEKLQKYFNYDLFRTGQKEIISDVLSGHDVFGILPTGTGKSLCYQLPAKLLPGLTIVVSPLISLMIDQVNQLHANQFKESVALTSFQSYEERKYVLNNIHTYKLIYISPELLQQTEVFHRLEQMKVSLFVIDEAHCISQWGHEFRPDYLRLDIVIKQLKNPPVLALSATATTDVQIDIFKVLKRPHMIKHIYPMDRENIACSIQEIKSDEEKLATIINILADFRVPTLIYFSSRVATERISNALIQRLPERNIAFYHGGMDQLDRISIQQQFMNDQLDIICCTNAFGMGIDKDNIRLVIHYHFPAQLESYIQEIGRAGRDGSPSLSVLLYATYDENFPRRIIENELPTEGQITFVFNQLYRITKNHLQLPVNEQDIAHTFQINEIQWRFIYFHLESNGIIKNNHIFYDEQHWQETLKAIQQQAKIRLILKQKKLNKMIEWMNEEKCLRESLYKDFQQSYQKPEDHCCSNCGFDITDWQPVKTLNEKTKELSGWEERLRTLLCIGEKNETK